MKKVEQLKDDLLSYNKEIALYNEYLSLEKDKRIFLEKIIKDFIKKNQNEFENLFKPETKVPTYLITSHNYTKDMYLVVRKCEDGRVYFKNNHFYKSYVNIYVILSDIFKNINEKYIVKNDPFYKKLNRILTISSFKKGVISYKKYLSKIEELNSNYKDIMAYKRKIDYKRNPIVNSLIKEFVNYLLEYDPSFVYLKVYDLYRFEAYNLTRKITGYLDGVELVDIEINIKTLEVKYGKIAVEKNIYGTSLREYWRARILNTIIRDIIKNKHKNNLIGNDTFFDFLEENLYI